MYEYAFIPTTPIAVDANTTYWLSVYNESSSLLWGWQIANDPTSVGAIQTDYAYGWSSPVNDAAFRIVGETGPVSVPDGDGSTLAFLTSGLVGVVIIVKLERLSHKKVL